MGETSSWDCKELSLLEECPSTVGRDDDCKRELSLLVVYHSGEEDGGLQDLSVLPGPCILTLAKIDRLIQPSLGVDLNMILDLPIDRYRSKKSTPAP